MSDASLPRRWPALSTLIAACLLLATTTASAQYGNLAFTVAPGGTINIQNLSGGGWYFYNNPVPTSATMFRVSENQQIAYAWGSAQFMRDLNGGVSKVNPREFLRVHAGSTPVGSVIRITYHDSTFDSNYSIDITVQATTSQVVSINRLDPSPNTSSSVRWEVLFDKAVAGVRSMNLALLYPANGRPNPAITSIAPRGGLDHTRWIVTADVTGRDAGTLALRWVGTGIERPAAEAAFTGQSYDLAPLPPTTFSAGQYDNVDIPNLTDDGWYFAGPPTVTTATMSRISADYSVVDQWGGANFGPNPAGVANKIARNQFLRIYTGATPLGSTIVVNYQNAQNVSRSISILMTNDAGYVVSMSRLDANPPVGNTVRWEVTFDRPVVGVRTSNFSFKNFAGTSATVTGLVPDAASGFRKWTVTAQLGANGVGPVSLFWNGSHSYHPETPYTVSSITGDRYDLNPLVFNVPPGGSIDILNHYSDRLYFRGGPSPSSARMSRLANNLINETVWGTAGFHYMDNSNTSNWMSRDQYLRIYADNTPVGTTILVRAYRTVDPADTGFDIRVKVEVPDAQVLSANIIDPSPTVAESVRWDVTFNKAMTGVTAANFGFVNVAQIHPTPTITSVAVVPNTGSTKWRVTASTAGTGTGFLGLRYLGHSTESPNAPNTFTGQFYEFSEYPLITADPTPLSAIIVTGGQAPTLSVTATVRTGETLHYNWRKRLGNTPHFEDPVVGTGLSFTPPTNVAGHYTYYCRVFTMNPNTGQPSGYYAHSLPSTMHIYDPPEIVEQPGDIALPPGGSGDIEASTTGTELQHQWFKGNSGDRSQPIANTNDAIYTTPALNENTRYWVLVSNPLGAEYEVESNTVTARVIKEVQLEQNAFTPVVHSMIDNMKARAFDSEGNATPGATITFAAQSLGHIGGAAAGGNFGGPLATGGTARANAKTDENGWATAPTMWTNTKAGTYQVFAMSEGPTTSITVPITIANQPGAPAAFAWVRQPSSSAVAGVPFAAQPALTLHDAYANVINGAQVTAAADKALGVVQGTTVIESANGQVTFTNLAHHTAEKLKLRISCGDAIAISNEITVVPGPVAAITAAAGTPQGALPGQEFALPLTAKVADAYGNGIAGIAVKFTSPLQKVSATFPRGSSDTTDAYGQASVDAQASGSSGSYYVTAVATQHVAVPAAMFQLSNFNNLEAWRAENFSGEWLSNGNAANGAMPFNDGVPNLLKYAFNLNAKAADYVLMASDGTRGLPLVAMDEYARLTVTYVRRKASTLPGIAYSVQFSDDLNGGAFAENPSATTSTPVAIDATWERVTLTDSVTATDTNAKRFARVQVSEL